MRRGLTESVDAASVSASRWRGAALVTMTTARVVRVSMAPHVIQQTVQRLGQLTERTWSIWENKSSEVVHFTEEKIIDKNNQIVLPSQLFLGYTNDDALMSSR